MRTVEARYCPKCSEDPDVQAVFKSSVEMEWVQCESCGNKFKK